MTEAIHIEALLDPKRHFYVAPSVNEDRCFACRKPKAEHAEEKPFVLEKSCNMHADCAAAEAKAKEDGKPERYGAGTRRLDHCYDDCCEDCFGS